MTDRIAAELAEVCAAFRIEGELTGYEIITTGNINTTYRVDFRRSGDGTEKSYIAQMVNTYVWQPPITSIHTG